MMSNMKKRAYNDSHCHDVIIEESRDQQHQPLLDSLSPCSKRHCGGNENRYDELSSPPSPPLSSPITAMTGHCRTVTPSPVPPAVFGKSVRFDDDVPQDEEEASSASLQQPPVTKKRNRKLRRISRHKDGGEDGETEFSGPSLWWTKEERSQILDQNRSELRAALQNRENDTQVLTYIQIFALCHQDPNLTETLFLKQQAQQEQEQQQDLATTKPLVTATTTSTTASSSVVVTLPTQIRGLEGFLLASCGFIQKKQHHRKAHMQQLLQVQDQLDDYQDEHQGSSSQEDASSSSSSAVQPLLLSAEFRSQILATYARQSSQPSRVLARLLGEGDLAAAKATTP